MTFLHNHIEAQSLSFEDDKFCVLLSDGREIKVPISWFPKLQHADKEALNDWRWIGNGVGIHWEQLDEDISIKGLLKVNEWYPSANPYFNFQSKS
jgi:hypothetical protein